MQLLTAGLRTVYAKPVGGLHHVKLMPSRHKTFVEKLSEIQKPQKAGFKPDVQPALLNKNPAPSIPSINACCAFGDAGSSAAASPHNKAEE